MKKYKLLLHTNFINFDKTSENYVILKLYMKMSLFKHEFKSIIS